MVLLTVPNDFFSFVGNSDLFAAVGRLFSWFGAFDPLLLNFYDQLHLYLIYSKFHG